jgi:hypothetical protein
MLAVAWLAVKIGGMFARIPDYRLSAAYTCNGTCKVVGGAGDCAGVGTCDIGLDCYVPCPVNSPTPVCGGIGSACYFGDDCCSGYSVTGDTNLTGFGKPARQANQLLSPARRTGK